MPKPPLVLFVFSVVMLACHIVTAQPRAVIESRCYDCHQGPDAKAGVDLTRLWSKDAKSANVKLWTRVERMVAAGRMPPKDTGALPAVERKQVLDWYRDTFVLRDGRPHIGTTPLRRLTRFELENTLEQLLAVSLKRPYVKSSESAGLLPSTIEQLYPADIPGASGFDNDAHQQQSVKLPLLKYIDCLDYALRMFDQNEAARRRVMGFTERPTEMTAERAHTVLRQFCRRAWRGHVEKDEQQQVLAAWSKAAPEMGGYQALLHAMRTCLLSPSFVYRREQSHDKSEPYNVTANELAVRLSYFLWSTMPDEKLFDVARDGSLLQPNVLRAQLKRMLNSPKRLALSESFAGQWLGFDELRRNKAFYSGENWTRGTYDELLFSFDELIKSDRSILEIVDADWAYLRPGRNRSVRGRRTKLDDKYADIFAPRRVRTGLKVERFYDPPRLYSVKGDRIGGLITTPGVMRLTSAPSRTSPIRRGVWVMEKIIGERMEPPENIPPLADSEKKVPKTQANNPAAILKVHTSRESCRVCHQHIDPLGLGLENFSPTGDWRTNYPNKVPIAAAGKLPNGKSFASPAQLKQELLAFYKDRIVDNAIRQMLGYAIGRELQPYDRITVRKIHKALSQSDYRMGTLIEQIIVSPQFLMRQQ